MNFMSEDDAKYFKKKNDETYINQEDIGDVTMLDEKEEVDDDDVMLGGGMESASLFRIKIANFLDSIKARLLGDTDISSIGDGTVTGAISENAKGVSDNAGSISDNEKSISQNADDIAKNKEETDAAIENLSDDVDKKYDELNSALAESNVMDYLGEAIPSGADLNDYTTPGKYYSESGTITSSLSNAPSISYGFTLIVIRTQQSARRLQLAIDTLGDLIFERGYGDTSWNDWTRFVTRRNLGSAFSIITVTSSNISISANTYTDITISTSQSGYTFLGISGWYIVNSSSDGIGSSMVFVNRQQISGSNMTVRLTNVNSTAAKVDLTMRLLYATSS